MSHFSYTVALYLATQGMITLASTEICIRYFMLYMNAKSEKKLLASLCFYMSAFFFILASNEVTWTVQKFAYPAQMAAYIRAFGVYELQFTTFLRVCEILALSGIMLPIWRLWDNFSYKRIALEVVARWMLASILYFFTMYVGGVLLCLVSFVCT